MNDEVLQQEDSEYKIQSHSPESNIKIQTSTEGQGSLKNNEE